MPLNQKKEWTLKFFQNSLILIATPEKDMMVALKLNLHYLMPFSQLRPPKMSALEELKAAKLTQLMELYIIHKITQLQKEMQSLLRD